MWWIMSRTLAIIKPDAFRNKIDKEIEEEIKQESFKIIGEIETFLTKETAASFYKEHRNAKFFDDLVHFMSSNKIKALLLEKVNAVEDWRKLVDKIRAKHSGTLKHETVVHGSDSDKSAKREIEFFFGRGSYFI